ncbi:hypothetical protein BX661DRAFT_198664 [Kickxella alabastrina]|uniref:uncharacterized protein n=1 Tax=Kickxella alabastrina TaxID=61397 RepID=UPI0022203F31|nr:uncharacterized protein BX661DRAFT_198664 [Kickxella alabastrina]KAI7827388.1 hypothetical protein BX661DRAFT_198664 [Kickxella alabastrina]KAJ1941843.1 hypothetical protein GGF37_003369 [Kickxella alabastrina]
MSSSNMDLDTPEDTGSQQSQPQRASIPATFTPPHSTNNTPQCTNSGGPGAPVASPYGGYRVNDSAGPESPAIIGGSGSSNIHASYVDYDRDYDMEQDFGGFADFTDDVRMRNSGKGHRFGGGSGGGGHGEEVNEAERIVHCDFFNNFGNDWMNLQ